MELWFEVAVTLLPLIGRCVEVVGGMPSRQHGNRLGSDGDRRLVIADVAERWGRLDDESRAGLGSDWRAAVAVFTVDYVDMVEAEDAGRDDYEQRQYEVTVARVWDRHAARLRERREPRRRG